MTNIEYYNSLEGCTEEEVRRSRDRNAAQFIVKMALLNETVTFDQLTDGTLVANTPLGQYWFAWSSSPLGGVEELVVDQVL